ncbi:FG-GAP-like repeat-containing protein [Nannocystis pusilla]|uniref:FG-GAP-like repeat-containing protein n=1 Tax=Nannocystis pusilla TaxID=889268 RepID=UPI003DA340EE
MKTATVILSATVLMSIDSSAAWAAKTPAQCGLTTIDPSSGVTIEACLDLDYPPKDVWVQGDFAYVGSGDSTSVFVYDISDPEVPDEIGEILGPGPSHGAMKVSDVLVGDDDVVYISYLCIEPPNGFGCTPEHKNVTAQTCDPSSAGTLDNPAALDQDGVGIHNLAYDEGAGRLYGAYQVEQSQSSFDGVVWWDVGATACQTGNHAVVDTAGSNLAGTHGLHVHEVGSTKYLLAAEWDAVRIYDITSSAGGSLTHYMGCNDAVCKNAHTLFPVDDVRLTLTNETAGGKLLGLLRSNALVVKGAHQIPVSKGDSYHQQFYDGGYLYAAAYQAGVRVWRKDPHDNDLVLYAYFDTSDYGGAMNNSYGTWAGAYAAHPAGHSGQKRYFVVTQHEGSGQMGLNGNQLYVLSVKTPPPWQMCTPSSSCKASAATTMQGAGGGGQGLVVAKSSDDGGTGQTGALVSVTSSSAGFGTPVSLSQAGLTVGHAYGYSIAGGDFDGDGWRDVAVGAPGQATGGVAAGAVYVYRGGATGFTSWAVLTQSGSGLGTNAAGDQFGFALTSGDFDLDGYADLAVGAPGATEVTGTAAGAVYLFEGGSSGLGASAVVGPALPYLEDDRFGAALTSADFNGDGYGDLVVGAPRGRYGTATPYGGAVFLYRGAATGLAFHVRKNQSGFNVDEAEDRFGAALAAGDFNGDGIADLAVGAWGEHIADISSGAVYAFLGTRAASALVPWDVVDQTGLDVNEEEDMFGRRLTAGDFTGDGRADLAVGAPGEMPGSSPRSGVVHMFKGSTAGLRPSGTSDQSTLATNDDQEAFGDQLASGDFDGDGMMDVVVFAPGLGGSPVSNPLFVFRGATTGLGSWQTVTLP